VRFGNHRPFYGGEDVKIKMLINVLSSSSTNMVRYEFQ
jgi:hypothetical protein